jgi:DNA-binding transcriptional MerR regulator
MPDNQDFYQIGLVGRDTGIGHDTLRTWGRRDGFAELLRNGKDKRERVYRKAQLRRLQRVRRLRDQRLPPGKLLPIDEQVLATLKSYHQPNTILPQDAT